MHYTLLYYIAIELRKFESRSREDGREELGLHHLHIHAGIRDTDMAGTYHSRNAAVEQRPRQQERPAVKAAYRRTEPHKVGEGSEGKDRGPRQRDGQKDETQAKQGDETGRRDRGTRQRDMCMLSGYSDGLESASCPAEALETGRSAPPVFTEGEAETKEGTRTARVTAYLRHLHQLVESVHM